MRYVFILLLLLAGYHTGAQNTLKVKSFSVDQGLPQSTVWDILQDDFGFLWISTADGLCRFDGYTFNTYRNNTSDSLSIGGNTMHLMSKDARGNIWFTHENGLDVYNSKHGQFLHPLRFTQTNLNGLNKTLGIDTDGKMWLWIRGQGLLRYDGATGKRLGAYQPDPSTLERPAQDGFVDRVTGEIIVCHTAPYLTKFNPSKNIFTSIDLPKDWNVSSALQKDDSIYLLGTSKGIVRLNNKTRKMEPIPFSRISMAHNYELFATTSLLHHVNDEFWIGTSNGIVIYQDNTRSFTHFYNSVTGSKENFFFVQKLFKDNSGNIWIGTNGDGLKRYSPRVPPWKHYQSSSDRSDIVKSVYSDGEDLVFVGYYQNGLDIFSESKGWIRKIRKGSLLPNDNVYCILGINEDELFIGFSGNPPYLFGILNLKKNTFTNLIEKIAGAIELEPRNGNPFISSVKTKSGTIIFNYQGHLLELQDKGTSGLIIRKIYSFENETINAIFMDSDETLWIGTMNGYFIGTRGGPWIKGNPIINKQVKTINEDAEGNIWMGTVSGLYVLSKNQKLVTTYRMGEELVNDFIYGILRDDYGDIWFSHNKGLTKYDRKKKSFRHFSVDDGLQANEFNTGAFYKSKNGKLYFGGINGTNSFHPEEITENHELPQIQITRLEVNDTSLQSNDVPWAQQAIYLDYTHNTLAFEVAGLEYTEPSKNKYSWRMTGLDRDWVHAGNRRFARYANLPPGDYTLEVKASNNDGWWNENPRRIIITITPPFWQTWWFLTLAVLLSISFIGLAAFLISRQRYKRKIAELLVQQKIQQDRERISRDLHDNVGALVSFVGTKVDWLLHNHPLNDETTQHLKVIKESATKTLTGLRETIWTLQDKAINNTDLADKLKVYIKSHLLVPCTISDEIMHEQPMNHEVVLNIYRACQEIINNINKHSQCTHAKVHFSNHTSLFEVDISDNGKGFQMAEFHQQDHYGLRNIQLRLEEVGATVSITSEAGLGTRIKIEYQQPTP